MKRSLLLGILTFTANTVISYGQGRIYLDNYNSVSHPLVKYGSYAGGPPGSGIITADDFTVGLYYVTTPGNFVANFNPDPTSFADPFGLYNGTPGTLAVGSGVGAIGGIADSVAGSLPGSYSLPLPFNPGLGEGVTVTMMIVAYKGSSYDSAFLRGHSTAFTMTTSTGSAFPFFSGNAETDAGIFINTIPEPSVFALAGIGSAALMLIRRKK